MATYEIRDPVHGFIIYDGMEKAIINSRPFQRLRRIKQLSTTYLVYPGAVHTRFEHSLGVMELASRIFDLLVLKYGPHLTIALGLRDQSDLRRLRRILRLAALLHDIGHAPFSHGPESLLPGGHEQVTKRLIEETEIRQFVEDRYYHEGIRVHDVVPVAIGPKEAGVDSTAPVQFLTELITGTFGADRIDYLLRDSLHTGVKYGHFDADRFIHTLTFIEHPETGDPVVALKKGGVHAAEGLVLARYFMFQQVYFHKVRRVYDHHLTDFLGELLNGGSFPIEDPERYLRWDDAVVEHELVERGAAGASPIAKLIVQRNHYRVAYEVPLARLDEDLMDQMDYVARELQAEFGAEVWVDRAFRPFAPATELAIPVVDADRVTSWEQESHLFRTLPPLAFARVYARNEKALIEAVSAKAQRLLKTS